MSKLDTSPPIFLEKQRLPHMAFVNVYRDAKYANGIVYGRAHSRKIDAQAAPSLTKPIYRIRVTRKEVKRDV